MRARLDEQFSVDQFGNSVLDPAADDAIHRPGDETLTPEDLALVHALRKRYRDLTQTADTTTADKSPDEKST
jgi:hypothetical protein